MIGLVETGGFLSLIHSNATGQHRYDLKDDPRGNGCVNSGEQGSIHLGSQLGTHGVAVSVTHTPQVVGHEDGKHDRANDSPDTVNPKDVQGIVVSQFLFDCRGGRLNFK